MAGLWGVQALAEIRGETELVDWYAGGPASIQTALNRPSSWQSPGSWNPAGYYNRGVNPDNSLAPLKDSSSDLLIALGVVDAGSPRAASHIATIASALTHDDYGLTRYPEDNYYNTAPWSPAGDEALSLEPVCGGDEHVGGRFRNAQRQVRPGPGPAALVRQHDRQGLHAARRSRLVGHALRRS